MLLEFRVENYLSFYKEVTFSMLAANSVKAHDGTDEAEDNNLLELAPAKERVLKFAALYGANGSGKSNFIRSIRDMQGAVLESNINDEYLNRLSANAFQLDVEGREKPSSFEVTFSIDSTIYRYGFEFFDGTITAEWLFLRAVDSAYEKYCFRREKNHIQTNPRTWKRVTGIDAKTRSNALYLSTCAQFNVAEAITIKNWFRYRLVIVSGLQNNVIGMTARRYYEDPELRSQILNFMHQIDAGIRDISVDFTEVDSLPNLPKALVSILKNQSQIDSDGKFKRIDIFLKRDQYLHGQKIGTTKLAFDLESEGTKKAFIFSGPWFDTLNHGGTLIVDEFGASLHTKLSIELVKVFQRAKSSQAQLIAATHDTNLLRADLLRRDQIWFAEKDLIGATDLYSLVEYRIDQSRSVRNNASFSKDYLTGRYGAIPYFGDIDGFLGGFGVR